MVTIGGGTGHYQILHGLNRYNEVNLTALVSVADNGKSSGRLREEFVPYGGLLPPGDLRNCLLALLDRERFQTVNDMFSYRYPGNGQLGEHNLGNLILAFAQKKYGVEGIENIARDVLKLPENRRVMPVSDKETHIYATTKSGKILEGQWNVSYPSSEEEIYRVWIAPENKLHHKAKKAIEQADLIVYCPGDFWGSIVPPLLTGGMREALKESKALKAYVCNLVTKQGTRGFKASDFTREIERYTEVRLDAIICNNKKPTRRAIDKYRGEEAEFVEVDITDERVVGAELLMEIPSEKENKIFARHNAEVTASVLIGLLNDYSPGQ